MNLQTRNGGTDVATYARALLACGGDEQVAKNLVQRWGVDGEASPRVMGALRQKAAIGTTGDELNNEDFVSLTSAFLNSLSFYGAFDKMLNDGMIRVPLQARFALATAAGTANIVNAGQVKPLTALSLSGDAVGPSKAVAHVVMSAEFARSGGNLATDIMRRELSIAVAASVDLTFLNLIANGAPTVSATGIDARAARRDMATALGALTTGVGSRLYAIMRSSTAKSLATMFDSTGSGAFPTMRPDGGQLCGVDVIVSDQVPSGDIIVVDAAQICAGDGGIDFRVGTHASVQMSSTPDSPATQNTVFVNLWQSNLTGLLAERYFSARVMGSSAVAVIVNSAYADSPAP